MAKEAVFTVKLETDLRDAFAAEAEAAHRPASQIVREFMREFVERHRRHSAASQVRGSCRKRRSRLSGLLLFFAAERQNEIRRGARSGGGGEDRFLIVLEDREILCDVLSVIWPRLVADSKLCAKECR